MKIKATFVAVAVGLLLVGGYSLAQNKSSESKWVTVETDEKVAHQLDVNNITKPDEKGDFYFQTRTIFIEPIQIDDKGTKVVATIMLAKASCFFGKSIIIRDVSMSDKGQKILENFMSKDDKLSTPAEGSIHSMVMTRVCGKSQKSVTT